jgi:hypothetical protein
MHDGQDFVPILYIAGVVRTINENNVLYFFFQTGKSHICQFLCLLLKKPTYTVFVTEVANDSSQGKHVHDCGYFL